MSDYYAQLGVGREASSGEIAIAYRQLVRQRHLERGSEANLGELSRAYRTLSSDEKRRAYDRSLQRLSGKFVLADPAHPSAAEADYLAGLEAMEQQSYQDAVTLFTRAAGQEPQVSHYHSQLGLALGMFRDRLAEAERCCRKAVELEPDNPELYYNLGFLFQRHNLNDAAQDAFSQAQAALAARRARYDDAAGPIAVGDGAAPAEAIAMPAPGGDLMGELRSIETTLDQGRPAPAPVETPAASSADDLLKELESIEAQVNGTAPAPAAIAAETEAGAQAKAMVPVTETKPAEPAAAPESTLSVDDLLKELEAMEQQVDQIDEYHDEPETELAHGPEGAAEPDHVMADPFAPPPPPDIYSETTAEVDAETIAAQAAKLLAVPPAPPEPVAAEPVQQEPAAAAPLPEPEPLPLENTAGEPVAKEEEMFKPEPAREPEPAAVPVAEAMPAVTPEPAPVVVPEPEPVPVVSRDDGHGEPVDPETQEKVKQLETLESEMEEELKRLRSQRQKLLGKKKK
jgi:curved DNA-binding protein CbpA